MSDLRSLPEPHTCITNIINMWRWNTWACRCLNKCSSELSNSLNYCRPARSETEGSSRGTVWLAGTPAAAGRFVPQTVPAVLTAVRPGPAPAAALLLEVTLGRVTVVLLDHTLTTAGLVFSQVGRHNPGQGGRGWR